MPLASITIIDRHHWWTDRKWLPPRMRLRNRCQLAIAMLLMVDGNGIDGYSSATTVILFLCHVYFYPTSGGVQIDLQ
jgi:hypothetical protein